MRAPLLCALSLACAASVANAQVGDFGDPVCSGLITPCWQQYLADNGMTEQETLAEGFAGTAEHCTMIQHVLAECVSDDCCSKEPALTTIASTNATFGNSSLECELLCGPTNSSSLTGGASFQASMSGALGAVMLAAVQLFNKR